MPYNTSVITACSTYFIPCVYFSNNEKMKLNEMCVCVCVCVRVKFKRKNEIAIILYVIKKQQYNYDDYSMHFATESYIIFSFLNRLHTKF